MEEVKLFVGPHERERHDNLADCYSIINTIQSLEKAYIKNAVTSKEYTSACSELLAQFKAAFKQIEKEFHTVEAFLKKYKFDCTAAVERINEGRPISIKDDKGNIHASIAAVVSISITISDRLKLGMKSMDELLPDMRDLEETMSRLTILPPSYEGPARVKKWIETMSKMNASDQLDEADIRQLTFDLDTSLNEFNKILQQNN